MKRKNNKLTLVAGVVTCIMMAITAFGLLSFVFNLFGIVDLYTKFLTDMGYSVSEVNDDLTFMYLQLVLNCLVNLFFARFYIRSYRFGFYGERHAQMLIRMGLIQMIFVAFLPGLLGLIAGIVMSSKKVDNRAKVVPQNLGVSDLKLEAMKQACARLKELRDKGAISEEEYYASLNKILEG